MLFVYEFRDLQSLVNKVSSIPSIYMAYYKTMVHPHSGNFCFAHAILTICGNLWCRDMTLLAFGHTIALVFWVWMLNLEIKTDQWPFGVGHMVKEHGWWTDLEIKFCMTKPHLWTRSVSKSMNSLIPSHAYQTAAYTTLSQVNATDSSELILLRMVS